MTLRSSISSKDDGKQFLTKTLTSFFPSCSPKNKKTTWKKTPNQN